MKPKKQIEPSLVLPPAPKKHQQQESLLQCSPPCRTNFTSLGVNELPHKTCALRCSPIKKKNLSKNANMVSTPIIPQGRTPRKQKKNPPRANSPHTNKLIFGLGELPFAIFTMRLGRNTPSLFSLCGWAKHPLPIVIFLIKIQYVL